MGGGAACKPIGLLLSFFLESFMISCCFCNDLSLILDLRTSNVRAEAALVPTASVRLFNLFIYC